MNTMPDTVEGLLARLIQFNTVRPGQEAACIAFLREGLMNAGIATQIVARDPDRPILLARLPGTGQRAPLLLYGHIDVVPVTDQPWDYPPFEARTVDGYIWGRGALDMKGGLAMMLIALLQAKAEGLALPGDVLLAVVSDEETGGFDGAKYLVEQHADYFQNVQYAIGEFGAFSLYIQGKRFYPIQVSEKSFCGIKVSVRGSGGHGGFSRPRGTAMEHTGHFLSALSRVRLPIHITPVVRSFVDALATSLAFPLNTVLKQIAGSKHAAVGLTAISYLDKNGSALEPFVRNTVNPTMIQSVGAINVLPNEVTIGLDGRLLPGYGPSDLIRELTIALHHPRHVQFDVVYHEAFPMLTPNMGLFDTLAHILREADPAGIPVPFLLPASSDARYFARLGIQTYGFLPLLMPATFDFAQLLHNANERVPITAIQFGTKAIYQLLQRF